MPEWLDRVVNYIIVACLLITWLSGYIVLREILTSNSGLVLAYAVWTLWWVYGLTRVLP